MLTKINRKKKQQNSQGESKREREVETKEQGMSQLASVTSINSSNQLDNKETPIVIMEETATKEATIRVDESIQQLQEA